MPRAAVLGDSKFDNFHISTYTYKVVDDHPILVDVLIPKALIESGPKSEAWAKKRPVVLKIHGGGLVGGQRDNAVMNSGWLISLALQHNAIIVSPDYRFIPEATVLDILDDMDEFMIWVGKLLLAAVRAASISATTQTEEASATAGLEVDLERVLVCGESAGGYLAIQAALSHFRPADWISSPLRIRALISIYPMLGLRAPHYTQSYPKQIMGLPLLPESLINDHLAAIRAAPRKPIVTNIPVIGASRGEIVTAIFQYGRYAEFYGEDGTADGPPKQSIHPEDRIVEGEKLPPTFLVHGNDDTLVPTIYTDQFIDLLKQHDSVVGPDGEASRDEVLRYARVPGEHGFDFELDPEKELWIKDGLDFIEKHWLG